MKKISNNQVLEEIAESLLEPEEFYNNPLSPLSDPQIKRQQEKLKIIEFLSSGELPRQMNRALELIDEKAENILSGEQLDAFRNNLSEIKEDKFKNPSPEVLSKMNDASSNLSYQEIFGISDESLKMIYNIGYLFFQDNEINEAIDIFTFLLILNPSIADFSYSLGLCYQQQGKWIDALSLSLLATHLNANHIAAHISAAECAKQIHDIPLYNSHVEELHRLKDSHPDEFQLWEGIVELL